MYDNLDKENLLKNIMSLDFSINDLSLYLDTHPDDRNALDKQPEEHQNIDRSHWLSIHGEPPLRLRL